MKVVLLLLGVLVLAAGQAWHLGWRPPAQWNPLAPLDVSQPPNWLTGFKLKRLRDDPALCQQALQSSQLRYRAQADSPASAKCPLSNVWRIEGGQARFSSSFLASCPLAVAYALFERHGLQPVAQRVLGQSVVQVDHLGSFACRNVYNRKAGRLSQHASANALDIAGFRLRDGQRIVLARDWQGTGDKAMFLREVRQAACEHFSTVLGPEYNAAHRDHFHVDMGRWQVCR
ncbi:extensin family protein [Pseudomonas fulva]|uniref:extensin-like domain-containing protein n=1 Tax=Pseudomonas TaxID=286 RepID=UPI000EC257B3|nr:MULTISPECIES: extensin family protein [Pseudomonas]HCL55171.1 extensin [Pseudomonas sp.]MBN6792730.1 extensin family protein [Pseudomonas fulva]MBN6794551.1 extensin family protein [Pseudomonas fulva]MBN6858346.1 extensin family protein [Pseudomonas fulva]MBN6873366.1 extensin family protein [Pseudomonas fulva]